MAASVPWHRPPLLLKKHDSTNRTLPRPSPAEVRASRRSDFDGFARRVSSGEALRDAWRNANEGIEKLAFEARRVAERVDRRYAVSSRIGSAARTAASTAREIDLELGIGRRWRSFSMDFSRNLPRYRKELNGFLGTPIGRGFMMAFLFWFAISGWLFRAFIIATWALPFAAPLLIGAFANSFAIQMAFLFWFALSGWLFRAFIIATWVLPFAAPLLIGAFANSFAIQGACPACKRQFVGYRNQVIQCAGCRNIVWQPGEDFSRNSNSSRKPSEGDIIDIEIEDK